MGIHRTRVSRPARTRNEQGALTPAVIVMAVGLLLLGGLVTDGGRQLNARLRAEATAEEAARAGSTMLDLRETNAVIDPEKARQAVDRYCTLAKDQDDTITACEVSDIGHDKDKNFDFVEVHVEITISPLLFGLMGVGDLHANATSSASAVQAVKDPYNDRAFPEFTPTPSYPTETITTTTDDNPPTSVTITPPDQYPTTLCGQPTMLPTNVGASCSTTTIPNPNPPPPSTETTTISTYPTNVTPTF
jgi:Putative Flp pilus-assembly TadE/G-like